MEITELIYTLREAKFLPRVEDYELIVEEPKGTPIATIPLFSEAPIRWKEGKPSDHPRFPEFDAIILPFMHTPVQKRGPLLEKKGRDLFITKWVGVQAQPTDPEQKEDRIPLITIQEREAFPF